MSAAAAGLSGSLGALGGAALSSLSSLSSIPTSSSHLGPPPPQNSSTPGHNSAAGGGLHGGVHPHLLANHPTPPTPHLTSSGVTQPNLSEWKTPTSAMGDDGGDSDNDADIGVIGHRGGRRPFSGAAPAAPSSHPRLRRRRLRR